MNGHRRGKSGDWQSQVKLSGKRTLFLLSSGKPRGHPQAPKGQAPLFIGVNLSGL